MACCKFYTFEVDIFSYHGTPNTMNVRTVKKIGVKWQMNNIMNNPKGDHMAPKDPR